MTKHIHTNSNTTYDRDCDDLAGSFLEDIDVDCADCRRALAIAIQTAIEDHLRVFEEEPS